MENHFIAWWNVENLFDEKNAPIDRRPSDIQRKIIADLRDWTPQVVARKIANLASIIIQMNNGLGPDILGVCEIENAHVLKQLVAQINLPFRNYQLIHHDMSDNRGIDVAFIYDRNKYQFNPSEFFHHIVIKRFPTREIIQATLITQKGNELVLIGNHWPARSAGQYESEPYRILAAETLSYFAQRIHEVKGRNVAIVAMGDFNDEPFSRSLNDYALSTLDRNKVANGSNPYFYNLMWPILGGRRGSFVYQGFPLMLDQFLVSRGISIKSGKWQLNDHAAKLEIFPGMVRGAYQEPIRFNLRRPNLNGYSDHLPISFLLGEK